MCSVKMELYVFYGKGACVFSVTREKEKKK